MKFEIKSRWNSNQVLFQTEAESLAACVNAAIKASADLRSADLRSANLSGADLSGADLSGADLRSADLRSANLSGADLSGADLSGADLSGADLSGADLSGANLSGADLSGANLPGADLRSANLSGANLSGADLSGANLPAPTMLLLAIWGSLSDELTADLMLLDASAHPDPEAFQKWADGGKCPYTGVKVQRIANFTENRKLWGKGKPDTIYNLMVRILKEKTKQ